MYPIVDQNRLIIDQEGREYYVIIAKNIFLHKIL